MSTIAAASFIATAETTVVWGRLLTTAEQNQLTAVKETAINAGRQCSVSVVGTDQVSSGYWASADDANSFAAAANSFVPAPTTACAVTAV